MTPFMNEVVEIMFNMFDEEYKEDCEYFDDKEEFIQERYNTTMMSHTECVELLNIIKCYTPSNTFEIFKYIREKRSEYNLEDDIEFIEKINSFRYFMAEDWSCSVNV
jgi:hypothetical protein